MKWVRRGFVIGVGGLFAFFFVAFVTSDYDYFGCDLCPPEPIRYDGAIDSSVRLLDCTSVGLDNGPFLSADVRAEFERLVAEREPSSARERFMQGELEYSPRGELQAISLNTSTGWSRERQAPITSPPFGVSPDQAVFYPLRSRQPNAACTTPTRVTFSCRSDASLCQLGASPA